MNDRKNQWNKIFGNIDLSKFNREQKDELLIGQDCDLPVHIYADPNLTVQQMRDIRTMMETVLEALYTPEKRLVCTEYGPEELTLGFKSETNFQHHPERVCYVPENWDFEDGNGITGQDILKLCDGDEILAETVFNLCDWEFPSTVLDQLDEEDYQRIAAIHGERTAAHLSLDDQIAGAASNAVSNTKTAKELAPAPSIDDHRHSFKSEL